MSIDLDSGSDQLCASFFSRLRTSLVTNNTLRGAWAEHVTGHYLDGIVDFADQWSYYDILWGDVKVSVKHSVNATARFVVKRSPMAYDPVVGSRRGRPPYTVDNPEGWRGHETATPQYWCDLYIFAWLPALTSNDTVLDPLAWRFSALTRAEMYQHFPPTTKTVGLSTLRSIAGEFVPGAELSPAARRRMCQPPSALATVPALDDRLREAIEAERHVSRSEPPGTSLTHPAAADLGLRTEQMSERMMVELPVGIVDKRDAGN